MNVSPVVSSMKRLLDEGGPERVADGEIHRGLAARGGAGSGGVSWVTALSSAFK